MTQNDGQNAERTLAIAGLGAIGMKVATAVDRGDVPGIRLAAVIERALDESLGEQD